MLFMHYSLSYGTSYAEVESNYNMFDRHANVQHIDLKVPICGRGGVFEDFNSILITVR